MGKPLHKINQRAAITNLLYWFDQASPAQLEAAAQFYPKAKQEAQDMSDWTGLPLEVTAAVISKMSPQCRWSDNVRQAWETLTEEGRPKGALQDSYARAKACLTAHYAGNTMHSVWSGKDHKTAAFWAAIVNGGQGQEVVCDVWHARAALQGGAYSFRDGARDENALILKRVGVYAQIAHATRLAAKRRNVLPCTFQAAIWYMIRGSID